MAKPKSAKRVTGRGSMAAVRRDIKEGKGRSPSTSAMRKAGYKANPRDKREALYNPRRAPK